MVNESGHSLEEIIAGAQKVADIIGEIAVASAEQASGIDQVNNAVVQMDHMTQDNAAMVEEAAAASRSMEHQVELLMQQVSFFKINDGTVSTSDPAKVGDNNLVEQPVPKERPHHIAESAT